MTVQKVCAGNTWKFTLLSLVVTLSSVSADAAVVDNLQAYWKLDEVAGSTAVDSQGGDDNGTLQGTTALNQPGIVGNIRAFDFTPPGDHVSINSGFIPGGYSQVTVTGWVNPESMASTTGHGGAGPGNSVVEGVSGQDTLTLQIGNFNAGTQRGEVYGFLRFSPSSTIEIASNVDGVSLNNWHHTALTYDGSSMDLFIDGQLAASIAAPPGSPPLQNPVPGSLAIGLRGVSTHNPFDGRIDDVGLWDTALTPAEIAVVHGLGRFVGLTLDESAIDDVLDAFAMGQGAQATAGPVAWEFASGLGGPLGTIGGSIAGEDAFIVLDNAGNGVQFFVVPEPGSLALAVPAMIALARLRRRKRRSSASAVALHG